MFRFWLNTFFVDTVEQVDISDLVSDDSSLSDGPLQLSRSHSDHLVRPSAASHTQLDREMFGRHPEDDETSMSSRNQTAKGLSLPASLRHSDPSHLRAFKVLSLQKSELDQANKDKQHRLFPADFTVSIN